MSKTSLPFPHISSSAVVTSVKLKKILVFSIKAVVCLLAAPRVQFQFSVNAGNGWPHKTQLHHANQLPLLRL